MRYLIALLFLTPLLASAKPKGDRTCRIVFAGAPADAPEKLHLFDGKKSQEVELPQMNLSPVYELPAGDIVVSLNPERISRAKNLSPDAPRATIAATATDIYLVVSSDPENEIAPVKIDVIDVTSEKAPKGRMVWYNLTENTVSGMVGDHELALEPDSKAVLEPPVNEPGQYDVNLSFSMPDKEGSYPLCETKWSHDGLAGNVLVIVSDSNSRTPRIMSFPDVRDSGK